jgi:hypothetical protein
MSRNTTAGNEIEHVIAKVFKKLTASLDPYNTNKIRNTYIFKSFEDIAIEAILYAMKNSKINWSDLASAEEHLFYSARKVSSWVISKELLKVKNSIVQYTFDSTVKGEENATQNWADSKHSLEEFNATKKNDELLAVARYALENLDSFLQSKGVSARNIAIYKAWELNKTPTDEVKEKYSITTSNLYRIVCIINAILHRHGRELIKAA